MTTLPSPSPKGRAIATKQDKRLLRDCAPLWLISTGWDSDKQEAIWTCPKKLTSEQAAQIEALKREHAERFQPALTDWIMVRIAAMLSLYWNDAADVDAEKRRLSIWAKHLSEYPQVLIERGISKWERTQSRRPTPADIRALAEQSGGEEWKIWRRMMEASLTPVKPSQDPIEPYSAATPEEKAEALRVLAETVAKLKTEHKEERQKVRDYKPPEADPAEVARRRAVLDRLAETAEFAPPVPGRKRKDEEYLF